jgi:DNA-binding response OmpR family regulator
MAMTPILIVEDDPKTARLIESYLHSEFFATLIAADGTQAVDLAAEHQPQLIILDVMLPKLDGWAVCTAIRKRSDVPILFLTARAEEVDRVLGFGLGGDDYLAKPFSPRELVARVKALLRRAQIATNNRSSGKQFAYAGLQLDLEKRRFLHHGQLLSLTPIEFTLLQTLIASPGRVFLRNELLDRIYPDGEVVVDRVIDVHIGKLRQKLGDDPNRPTYIHTIRGIGYSFTDNGD